MKKYILLVVLSTASNSCFAEVTTSIKPYSYGGNITLDTQVKILYDKQVKAVTTFIPLQVRQNITVWNVIPEYYISVKDDHLGRITIGAHNANILMVDAGSFTVGNGDILTDGNHLYSQSLINKLQPQGYTNKVSYLFKHENFYFSSAYSPLDYTAQVRVLYANNISASTDFKASVGVINNNITAGFNLKYLGYTFGGSYGGDFYTAGIGYSIGPFKSSLTYFSQENNTILGMQYRMNANVSPFLQVGYSTTDQYNISLGLKLVF